jgi:hypothetical protein
MCTYILKLLCTRQKHKTYSALYTPYVPSQQFQIIAYQYAHVMQQEPVAAAVAKTMPTKSRQHPAWQKDPIYDAVKQMFPRADDGLYHTDKSNVDKSDVRFKTATAYHATFVLTKKIKADGKAAPVEQSTVMTWCNE